MRLQILESAADEDGTHIQQDFDYRIMDTRPVLLLLALSSDLGKAEVESGFQGKPHSVYESARNVTGGFVY